MPKKLFKPGESGNPAGRPKLPAEIKAARQVNQLELERLINHVAYLDDAGLKEITSSKTAPRFMRGVAKVMERFSDKGDLWSGAWLLDRMIGRPGNAPPIDVTPTEALSTNVAPTIKDYKMFCHDAGYFVPFEKQEEMRAFAMDLTETRLLLGARGYGKTDYCTIMGVAYDLYLAYKTGNDLSEHTTLIITKSKSRNTAIMNEIANALTKHEIPLEKQNSTVIRVEGIIGQDHSVEAITIKTSMRGRHPKRIVMDDPVTDEDTSEAMRTLVKKKYDESYKLCKNIVIIGQPAHRFDLYAELRDVIKTMLVPHGSIPELDADLSAMKLAGVDEQSIEMSYHLKIPEAGTAIFANLKFVDKYPNADSVAFVDPSDGGDFTALAIGRGYFSGVAIQGHAWQKAWYHCLDAWVPILKERGVRRLFFETNCTGTQPIEQLRAFFKEKKLDIGVVGVHSDTNKHSIIQAAGVYSHMIFLSKESDRAYTDQVTKYEHNSKYDDAPDSMARLLERLGLIRGKK